DKGHSIPVGEHHTLRLPSRSGGIENVSEIVCGCGERRNLRRWSASIFAIERGGESFATTHLIEQQHRRSRTELRHLCGQTLFEATFRNYRAHGAMIEDVRVPRSRCGWIDGNIGGAAFEYAEK